MAGAGIDVLLVSLGATPGLRRADDELAASMERAGASVEISRARSPRPLRTFALTDLSWALAARHAAREGIERTRPRAVVYSTTTAALLWPRRGAIRFDAPATENRPGRHGLWQRPVERRRLRDATLLLPWDELPPPIEPSGPPGERDIAALTYGSRGPKKGLDRALAAWREARASGEELVVIGVDGVAEPGVRFAGPVAPAEARALMRRARVFISATRREDFGIAQLEALADGCVLAAIDADDDYPAARIARRIAPAAGEPPARTIRSALDAPPAGYAARAAELLAPFRRDAVDAQVRDVVLPRLLS